MPTAPDEGRRRTFSRRYIKIELPTQSYVSPAKKQVPLACGELRPVARLKGASAQPRTRQLMPTFSQRILPGLPGKSEISYAAFPVWSESTPKPVQFSPLPKKEVV